MEWLILGAAILFEVTGTICLKLSEGFSRLAPSLAILPFYGASLALLTLALKSIPISTAYAIWAAVGTGLVAVIGIAVFREPVGAIKVASLVLIVVGVVGLHMGDRLATAP
jgi:small multidrug resistance pump